MTDEQIDKADEAGEQLEEATEDVTRGTRWYARTYLTVLFALVVAGVVGSVAFGYLDPHLTITATVDVGWLLEYLAMGVAAVFIVWTVAMVLIALPGLFLSGVISAAARIADAYELPGEE
jgi:hypothetical protein